MPTLRGAEISDCFGPLLDGVGFNCGSDGYYRISQPAPKKHTYWLARNTPPCGGGVWLYDKEPLPANNYQSWSDGQYSAQECFRHPALQQLKILPAEGECVPITITETDEETKIVFKKSEARNLKDLKPKEQWREWCFADRNKIPSYIKLKGARSPDTGIREVTGILQNGLQVTSSLHTFDWKTILSNYTCPDGSPCGVKIDPYETLLSIDF